MSDVNGIPEDKSFRDAAQMSLVVRKPVFGVSDQVPHEPGCTATECGWKLEISDLGSREQRREGDLRLCFRICKKPVFSRRGSNYHL